MSIVLVGSTSGSITLQEPAIAGSNTINFPAATGTAILADGSNNLQMNSGYGSNATAYGCRAWVNFNGTSTVAIRASGNVTSITDNGAGDFTINFTTAMPDANYAVTCNAADVNTSGLGGIGLRTSTAPATGSVRVGSTDSAGGAFDFTYYHYAIFR